jgi:hypothetical protein
MNNQQIPTPAHLQKRREVLPWQQPKATEEDPEALLRVHRMVIAATAVGTLELRQPTRRPDSILNLASRFQAKGVPTDRLP